MVEQALSKPDVAKNQLDTAIDLWFEGRDSVSVYTLAFASLSVLMNIYSHHAGDGFFDDLDVLMRSKKGTRTLATAANFFKHADNDPTAVIENFQPHMAMTVIAIAIPVYRRLSGSFTPKMNAFAIWSAITGTGDLGLEEVDGDPAWIADEKYIREAIKEGSRDGFYRWFIENYDLFQEGTALLR